MFSVTLMTIIMQLQLVTNVIISLLICIQAISLLITTYNVSLIVRIHVSLYSCRCNVAPNMLGKYGLPILDKS